MSRVVWAYQGPFDGVAESAVTSNVIDLRDAVDYSLSWNTTSGTTSLHTLQVSNHTAKGFESGDIPEASWVDDITFGTSAAALRDDVPQPVRWGRILREASGASVDVRVHKLVG